MKSNSSCLVYVHRTYNGWTARTYPATGRSLAEDARRSAADGPNLREAALTAASLHLDVPPTSVSLRYNGDHYVATTTSSKASAVLHAVAYLGVCYILYLVLEGFIS